MGLLLALSSQNLLGLELESPGRGGEGLTPSHPMSWAGALVCGPQALKAEHGGRGAFCWQGIRVGAAHAVLSQSPEGLSPASPTPTPPPSQGAHPLLKDLQEAVPSVGQ